jgi:hypothetical protein
VNVSNGTSDSRTVTCGLGTPGVDNSGSLGASTDASQIQLAAGDEQSMTLLGPVDLSTDGDVTLDCFIAGPANSTGSVDFSDIQVSAIEVGNLN